MQQQFSQRGMQDGQQWQSLSCLRAELRGDDYRPFEMLSALCSEGDGIG